MFKISIVASVAVLALMAAPSFAQEMTINGTPVPADKVEAMQAHCDEVLAGATAADAPSVGAGTEQDEGSDETATGTEGTDGSPSGTDEDAVDFATLDMTTIDAAACTAGGFTATAN